MSKKEEPKEKEKQQELPDTKPDGGELKAPPPKKDDDAAAIKAELEKAKAMFEESQKDIDAMRQHNKELSASIQSMSQKKTEYDIPEPDPTEDFKAWSKWNQLQMQKTQESTKATQEELYHETLRTIESGLHEDYNDMVNIADREMARDKQLENRVWSSKNPYRAAYQLGKKKSEEFKQKEDEARKRGEDMDKAALGGAGDPPPEKDKDDITLTDPEKRIAVTMLPNIPPDQAMSKYLDQKKQIESKKKGALYA